jgi:hypothetical protein
MKSVLIGADILKLDDGYKLLEINTDADLFLPDIPYLDLEPLFTYLNENEYVKLVVIYKRKHIAPDVLNLFEAKCVENSIEFNTILVMDNSVTIPSIIEESNTFYLRCAYDVTAIIDDTYCRDKSEVTKLLIDSDNDSIIPKTYVKYTGDDSIIDNLSDLINNGLSPNVIAKKILPDFDKAEYPAFYKLDSESQLNALKLATSDDVMLQEYEINSTLSANGQISDVIRLNVVLLSDIETIIPLGVSVTNNQLPLDASVITYTDNKLDNKWKPMYFSNPNLIGLGVPDNYEVIKIVDDVEETVTIGSLIVGDIIKSIKLPELSTTASMQETMDWYISSNQFNTATYETASVQFITKKNYEGWMVNIEYGNSEVSGSSLLSNNEILLISSSVNNDIRFETAYEVTLNDLIITSKNLVLPITNKENYWYSGSIVILDIEPSDVFPAGTNTNEISKNNIGNILIHNKCYWSGFCCVSEDTIISMENLDSRFDKSIKDIQKGDLVWSYNFNTNTKELKEVLEIVSPVHDNIVEITFSNGITNKNTFDHLYYNSLGEMISYKPEETQKWFNGIVEKMQIGDKCLDKNGNVLEIVSINENINPIQTYTLFVKDNKNFYANGVLVYDEQK